MTEYIQIYDDISFWKKVKRASSKAGSFLLEKALILFFVLQDKDTPAKERAIILGALGYFIFPLDLIPDFTPVIGYSDDLASIIAALTLVSMHIKHVHVLAAKDKIRTWFD